MFIPKSLADSANQYAKNQNKDVPTFKRGVGIGLIERAGALLRFSSTTPSGGKRVPAVGQALASAQVAFNTKQTANTAEVMRRIAEAARKAA